MGFARKICRNIGVGVLTALFIAVAPTVQANPWSGQAGREGGSQGQRAYRQNDAQRQSVQRDDRSQEQRQRRMSEDERRQLRRDIRDAGQEVYRPRR